MAGLSAVCRRNYLILCLISIDFCFGTLKLNVPKLLLPYFSQVRTNFTLEATEGCLIWRSTRTDVVQIHPMASMVRCSRSAVVVPMSRSPKRKTAIIIAEDESTGRELRCDVIVDQIVSMEMRTTTKELYLDDSPDEFDLVAYNDKGDVFSSLEGMEFEWILLADKETGDTTSPNKVLRILKYDESSYVAPPHIKTLENQNKRGDKVLIKGLHTGTAIVSVRPVDEVYEHIEIPSVRTVVVANFQISPGLVYILPLGEIKFTIELLKQGKVYEVSMPSTNYYLEVEDKQVADLDVATTTIEGLSIGFTEMKLKGQNTQLAGVFMEPSAGIHVVYPSYIELSISPKCSWVLEKGSIYTIELYLYDDGAHLITVTQNLIFETHFPPVLEVISSTHNGTHHVVKAASEGSGDIHSYLQPIARKDGEIMTFNSEGKSSLIVLEPITLNPAWVVLPYIPGVKSLIHIQANGGTGSYIWNIDDLKFGSVDDSGVQVSDWIGSTQVHAIDSKYSNFMASAKLTLAPPTGVSLVGLKVEVESGKTLEIPIRLFAAENGGDSDLEVTRCDHVSFQFSSSDNGIIDNITVAESNESNEKNSCAVAKVLGSNPGNTELTISYNGQHGLVTDSIVIAVYSPLVIVDPHDGVVLTPGSISSVVLVGGPSPWVLDPSGYYRSVDGNDLNGIAEAHVETVQDGKHILHLLCLNFGETSFNVEIGNHPTQRNRNPDISALSIKIFCSEPKSMKLISDVAINDGCPITAKEGLNEVNWIPVSADVNVIIRMELYNEMSRIIINTTSLATDWSVSDDELATLQVAHHGRKDIILIQPSGKTGLLTVTATVASYEMKYEHIQLSSSISRSISFQLMKQPSLSTSEISLLNHRMVQGSLQIHGGSGYYLVTSGERNVADVVYDALVDRQVINVIPFEEGRMEVSVSDLCLLPSVSSRSSVLVSDVKSVLLSGPKKVLLHGETQVTMEVFDGSGGIIPSEFYRLVTPVFKSSSDILHVSENMELPSKNSAAYRLEARSLGSVSLVVAILNPSFNEVSENEIDDDDDLQIEGRMIFSNVLEIQIFAPLRIEPKEITITTGTAFHMQALGGPLSGGTVEFIADGYDTIATITKSGLMRALNLGVQRIAARSVGDEGGMTVVYSEDFAIVTVVEMTSVKINCPIKIIQVENEMPLLAMGFNGQIIEPFSFTDVSNFDWSVSDPHIALLLSPFENQKRHPLDLVHHSMGFAVRFVGLNPGQVTVTLKMTDPNKRNMYTDSVTIEVLESFKVITPLAVAPSRLIMMPDTELTLTTTLDNIHSTGIKYYPLSKDGLVHVDDKGVFRSGHFLGSVPMFVLAHNSETQINQTLSFMVEVKPLSYIMARPLSQFHDGSYRLPLGHAFELEVGCYDNTGSRFHAVKTGFSFQLNRHDGVQVTRRSKEENIIIITTIDVGYTILKIYASSEPTIADYIGVEVVESLVPSDVVVPVGSVVCFHSTFTEDTDHLSHWSSSNDDLVSVDQSGIAVTHGAGNANVIFTHKRFTVKANVRVLPIVKVDMNLISKVMTVSNSESSKLIRVLMSSHDGAAENMVVGDDCINRISQVVITSYPYSCSAWFSLKHDNFTLEQVFKVIPFFDHATGHYHCKFIALELTDKLSEMVAIFTVHIHLSASPETPDPSMAAHSVTLQFLPAFHIIERRSLLFSNKRTEASLKILTTEDVLKQLVVTSEDESIVKVSKLPRYLDNVATFYLWLLRLPEQDGKQSVDRVKVTVSCNATGQVVQVFVKVNSDFERDQSMWGMVESLMRDHCNWWFYGTIIIFSIPLLTFAYPMFQKSRSGFVSNNLWIFNNVKASPDNHYQHQHQQRMIDHNTPAFAGGSPRKTPKLWSNRSP